MTARRLDSLKAVAEDIKNELGSGVQVLPIKLDVSKPDEVRNFVGSLPAEFKEIDVLVNCAYAKPVDMVTSGALKLTGVVLQRPG